MPQSDRSHSKSSAAAAAQPERLRVLIVEDNPGDVFLLKQALLRHRPCVFDVAMTGDLAIELIAQSGSVGRADLVILDLNLPGSDGRAVLECIRSDRRFATATVIVLSSLPAEIQKNTAKAADSYLTKPIDLDQYLALGDEIFACYGRTLANRPLNGQAIL